ncbi:integral membrane PTH11 [Fusarium albosuccineum]|uniref:Integral membrane PTH11 n=1 Tax=Fusarium albosuccineum TaxID=1237068 RepID=A0A8H4KXD4_9HYPO|nr:integral membrane PTH11 [Fusarium albosuccineum]
MSAGASPSPEFLAETRGPIIRCTTWASVAIPIVVVALRTYTRLVLRKVFGLDDWVIVFSLVLLISYGGIIEAAVQLGLGRHLQWVLINVPENAVPIALLGQISQPFVIMSCVMGKTSFSITLMRLATQRFVHWFLWFVVVSMIILHILISFIIFVRCKDPRTTWNPAIVSECWSPDTYLGVMYFIGAYSAATDFVLALLPWTMLWNLNMKKKEKFGVAVAISLGIFAGSIAVIKCTKLSANAKSVDPTYDVAGLLLWAGAENALIIIAACLSCLRPMLSAVFPTTNRSNEDSYALKDMSNNIMFIPKHKAGQWSTIIKSEAHPDNNSDNQSERSILNVHCSPFDGQNIGAPPGSSSGSRSVHIKKTTAIIAGSSRGVGRGFAEFINKHESYRLVAAARSLSDLDYLPNKPNVLKVVLDLLSPESVKEATAQAVKAFGRIDVVLNPAGNSIYGDFEATSDKLAHDQFEVNFWGAVRLAQESIRIFREDNTKTGQIDGVYCLVSSVSGRVAFPGGAYYFASRFAWEGFVESLSKELPPEWNIHLTTVEPAAVKTDYLKKSVVYPERHPAYENSNSGTNNWLATLGKYINLAEFSPPEPLVEVVYEIIKGGVAGHGIPRCLPAGPDSWTLIEKSLEKQMKVHQDVKSAAFRMLPDNSLGLELESFI